MSNPCATCTYKCCHHYTVTVTGYDAWLIANGMGLAPEQFLVALRQPTPNPRGFALDNSGQTFDIALDKAPADTPERPCVFLIELPGGGGRCGIYPLRPYVCQTYPAYLLDGAVARREDVLCPTEAWRDGALRAPIWRERLARMQVEFDIYALAVARWNYHVRQTPQPGQISLMGYFAYLLHFYDRLQPARDGLGPAGWQAMAAAWTACCRAEGSPLTAPRASMAPWAAGVAAIHEVAAGFFPHDRPRAGAAAVEPQPGAV
jgi:Fe-S-cluster containining protein